MADIRGAQYRRDTTEGITARGFKAGTFGDYARKVEDYWALKLTHYCLTKREEKRLRLEEA